MNKTKLNPDTQPGTDEKIPSQSINSEKELRPKSYKLRGLDIDRLKGIVKEVNKESKFKMRETDVIKGLIFFGTKMKIGKIIQAYKDAL